MTDSNFTGHPAADDDLLLRCLDGEADQAERDALAARLEGGDEVLRQRLAALTAIDAKLRTAYAREDDGFLTATLHQLRDGQAASFRLRVMRRVRTRRVASIIAVAAAVLMAVGAGILWQPGVERLFGPPASGLQARGMDGLVVVWRGEDSVTAHQQEELLVGDRIQVREGHVGFGWQDGTDLWLSPGSELVVMPGSGKQLRLITGSLEASVAKQPTDTPMRVHSANAAITVLGTRFRFAAGSDSSELHVHSGLVAVAGEHASGDPLHVRAGQHVVLSRGEPPRQWQLQTGAAVFSQDFREDLPSGWRAGDWHPGQHDDEGGYLTGDAQTEAIGGREHAFIRSNGTFPDGLGAYRPGDQLTIRVRMDTSEHAMLALRLRNPGADDTFNMVYRLQAEPDHADADGWQDLRVPLAAFAYTESTPVEPGARYMGWYLHQPADQDIQVQGIRVVRGRRVPVE